MKASDLVIPLIIGAVLFFRKQSKGVPADIERASQELAAGERGRFIRFCAEVRELGWEIIFTSLTRSFQEQQQLYDALPHLAAQPGYSFHNYGLAWDANFKRGNTNLMLSSSKQDWEASGIPAIAASLGIRWGGNFQSFDPVHFDFGYDYDINELYDAYVS